MLSEQGFDRLALVEQGLRDARCQAFAITDLTQQRRQIASGRLLGRFEEMTLAVKVSASTLCHILALLKTDPTWLKQGESRPIS